MGYKVERITDKDALRFRQLIELFGDVFEDEQNYLSDRPSDEYLEHFLQDETHIVLAASEGAEVIGGLVAYTLTKFEMDRKEVFVYDLAVSGDYQRRGIGRSLMNKVKQVASEIGAYVVFVQADEGDEAIQFYEALHPDDNLKTRNFDYLV